MCKISLRLQHAHSLKYKRRLIKPILARVSARFNASISEIGENDVHSRSLIGFAIATSDARTANMLTDTILRFIEHSSPEVELLQIDREILTGF